MKIIKSCRNCKNTKLDKLFSLGNLSFTGKFTKKKYVKVPKDYINLIKCKKCHLVQLDRMKNTMQSLDKINLHVNYYSFLKYERFSENDFRDADHLNEKVAEKFTKLLNNLINN